MSAVATTVAFKAEISLLRWVLLEKPVFAHLVKKFAPFYGN
jgi:hypothetical protein